MIRLIRVGYIAILCLVLANCSGGALGMVGSPAWYMTASKEAIKEYESNGGSRRSASTSYNSVINTPSITSSRVSSSGRNIFNSDGTSSRHKFDLAYFSTPKACSTSMKKVLYELKQEKC